MTPVMMINGTAVPLGGEALSAGEGIRIEDGTVQVTTPVKGLTQAEYDRLPERERGGLCVITDAATVLPEGGEVYSTEETQIGTWIDGKPLYRKVFHKITSASSGRWVEVLNLTDQEADTIIRWDGRIAFGNGQDIRNIDNAECEARYVPGSKSLQVYTSRVDWSNLQSIFIAEYTKTDDQGVSE